MENDFPDRRIGLFPNKERIKHTIIIVIIILHDIIAMSRFVAALNEISPVVIIIFIFTMHLYYYYY